MARLTLPAITPRQAAVTAGYLLLGTVGTAAVAMAALAVTQPIQPAAYHLVYRRLGPGDATVFAILIHFLLAASVALTVAAVAGEYLSTGGAHRRPFLVAVAAMAALLVAFVAVAAVGLVGLPIALGWVLVVGLVIPLVLRFGYGVRSGGLAAFVGGVPVVVFLLLLAGFGIGWGWGYVLTAEPIPEPSVGGAPVADFDTVPQVRDDLFTGDCSDRANGGETCYLQLRSYEHAGAATAFLAAHGVRCPYQGTGADPGSFVARHDGTYYRVSCGAHGD